MIRLVKIVALLAAIWPVPGAWAAQPNPGGGLIDVDYFSPSTDPNYSEHLWAVEEYHYKPAVNWLMSGSPAQARDDIEFILRHFPNHPKALALAFEYGKRIKQPDYALPLYQKAVQMNPKIAGIWSDFGTLQHELKNYTEAVACFEKAVAINAKTGIYRYNLGLSLFEIKEYEKAQVEATAARDMGVPFTALQDKLDGLKKPKPASVGKKSKS